jgi:hypothetical protein
VALKEYEYLGSTFQFEESEAPKGAKLIKKAGSPANKQAAPANKDAGDGDQK